jgi:hypothetical protein
MTKNLKTSVTVVDRTQAAAILEGCKYATGWTWELVDYGNPDLLSLCVVMDGPPTQEQWGIAKVAAGSAAYAMSVAAPVPAERVL